MKKIDTTINFGGFYESIHDSNIESLIESYNEEGNYPEYNFENIDYKNTNKSYIEDYCYKFTNYIFNEYGFNIKFENLKLWSPSEYNFNTDKIDCQVNKFQSNKLINHFKKDDDFLEYLEGITRSYDGYQSFYTFDDALNNKNNILIMYLLEYLSNEFNKKQVMYGEIEFEIYLLKQKKVA
tara:strand:- start:640 stop:1182 length:543 start_codon:yes stop_codon:yes gene_type:complete